MAGRLTLQVPDGSTGRVDRFVADASGLSRAYVQRLISEGRLTRGGAAIKANAPLEPGSTLVLDVPEPRPSELQPETRTLPVLYEDDDVLVIDKPAGLVTHPGPGHDSGTLVNALLGRADASQYGSIAGTTRPGIVHRLDRDTSGALMIARNDAAQRSLMAQLKARRVRKTYLALVSGSLPAELGRIEAPIGRDPRHRTRMAVVPDGRDAITGYRVRERFDGWTLAEMDLVTGRTHQIRVHLASIGHPVAGDRLYGSGRVARGPDELDRLFLHSWKLEFTSVSSERLVRVTAPLPDDLERVLAALRAASAGQAGARR